MTSATQIAELALTKPATPLGTGMTSAAMPEQEERLQSFLDGAQLSPKFFAVCTDCRVSVEDLLQWWQETPNHRAMAELLGQFDGMPWRDALRVGPFMAAASSASGNAYEVQYQD